MKDKMKLNMDAVKIRQQFGYSPYASVDIFSALKNERGFTVTFYPMSRNISGMCRKIGGNYIIFINSDMSYGRQRFTAAHELYHLLVEKKEGGTVCNNVTEGRNESELDADAFASYFLIPYEALYKYLEEHSISAGNIRLEDIISTEQYFQISHMAILRRLKEEAVLDAIKYREFRDNPLSVAALAREAGYSDTLYQTCGTEEKYKTYGAYLKKASEVKNKNLISESRYEEIMRDGFREDILEKEKQEDFVYD